MHMKRSVLIAAAAVLVISLAAGAGYVARSDSTPAAAGASAAVSEPDGAEEWMYLQRANPDGTIPDAAVNDAIAQSKAMGTASKGSPSTDQVWTEFGPSNI